MRTSNERRTVIEPNSTYGTRSTKGPSRNTYVRQRSALCKFQSLIPKYVLSQRGLPPHSVGPNRIGRVLRRKNDISRRRVRYKRSKAHNFQTRRGGGKKIKPLRTGNRINTYRCILSTDGDPFKHMVPSFFSVRFYVL